MRGKIILNAIVIAAIIFIAVAAQAVEKIIVVDDAKRSVLIPAKPKRIVVLNASNLEMLYAVGGKAIARPESTGMPKELLNKVKSLPSVGETHNPNIEKIVSLKPDLVIGANVSFHHQIIPPLQKAGIPVILLSINNYEDVLSKLRFFGKITGNQEKAETIIKGIEKRVKAVKDKVRNVSQKQPKVVIIWGSTQSFNMALPNSFVGNIVEMLGADNIAKDVKPLNTLPQYAPLSLEFVLSKDPDVVLVITHGYDDKVKDKLKREIMDHPAWKGMRAVKEGRIYILPYELFGINPSVRVADAIEYIARLLYPEVFK
ncbi:MAG: ABC transporter substrate-binding protein [candidate division WOR-3 bacterium]